MNKNLFILFLLLFGTFMMAQKSEVSIKEVPDFETKNLEDYSRKYLNEFQSIEQFKAENNQERVTKSKERILRYEAHIKSEVLSKSTEGDRTLFEQWNTLLLDTYQIKK